MQTRQTWQLRLAHNAPRVWGIGYRRLGLAVRVGIAG